MKYLRVGLDIGGTFTDVVVFDERTLELKLTKTLTTIDNPIRGILNGLNKLSIDLTRVKSFVHASTLGSNVFLGQLGLEIPKAVLITNKGFRDVLEIGRQNRPKLYDPFFTKPKPLIPRSRRLEVRGRIGPHGEVIEELDVDEIRRIAREWCGRVRIFIVAFLHSYANPLHEKLAKQVIESECPNSMVIASHEVDPQPKEYERFSTTVVNALLRPVLSNYLTELVKSLRAGGFDGDVYAMQSSGGLVPVDLAIEKPVLFIESGPAAGSIATSYFSKILGLDKVISFDMGGTTAKVCAIVNGEPLITSEYEVGGEVHMGRLIRGSGYVVRASFIDLVEVSAGGGTIAWIDSGGVLRVGPKSAGSHPGPVCYGRGGKYATVTDANFILGRLPRELAGGEIVLQEDPAKDVLSEIGKTLGLSIEEVALGIIKISNALMARAIRIATLERGLDPREFRLFAFGGAGPLHAVELAQELGIPEVLIPPMPGVLSALGLILADYKYEVYTTVMKRADEVDDTYLFKVFESLVRRAHQKVMEHSRDFTDIRMYKYLTMRYKGQGQELLISYSGSISECIDQFHKLYETRYGYHMPEEPVEIVLAKVVVLGIMSKPRFTKSPVYRNSPRHELIRKVYFEDVGWIATRIYRRENLRPGAFIEGPSIVEEYSSTILIPPRCNAFVDEYSIIHVRCEK